MVQIFKIAALVVLTTLALGAVAAQAAEFTASEYPAEFHGENAAGNEVFETEAGVIECDSTVSGEFTEATTTYTGTPTKSNCEAFGFVSATVNMEGCHDTFHVESSLGTDKFTASATYNCPPGKSIKVTAVTCELEIGSQGPLPHVLLTDTTDGTFHIQKTVEGIAYTVTKDGFLCPFSGTGAREDGADITEEPMSISSEQSLSIE